MYRHKYEKYKAKYLELKRAASQPYNVMGGGKTFKTLAMDAKTEITVEADDLDDLREKLRSALGVAHIKNISAGKNHINTDHELKALPENQFLVVETLTQEQVWTELKQFAPKAQYQEELRRHAAREEKQKAEAEEDEMRAREKEQKRIEAIEAQEAEADAKFQELSRKFNELRARLKQEEEREEQALSEPAETPATPSGPADLTPELKEKYKFNRANRKFLLGRIGSMTILSSCRRTLRTTSIL